MKRYITSATYVVYDTFKNALTEHSDVAPVFELIYKILSPVVDKDYELRDENDDGVYVSYINVSLDDESLMVNKASVEYEVGVNHSPDPRDEHTHTAKFNVEDVYIETFQYGYPVNRVFRKIKPGFKMVTTKEMLQTAKDNAEEVAFNLIINSFDFNEAVSETEASLADEDHW